MASKARRVCRMRTQLSVVIMKEGKYFIAYAPALDYSTCGRSVEEAQRMFGKGVKIFLSECVKMGTLESVLSDCGWRRIEQRTKWVSDRKWPKVVQIEYEERFYKSAGDKTNALQLPRLSQVRTDKKVEECINPEL